MAVSRPPALALEHLPGLRLTWSRQRQCWAEYKLEAAVVSRPMLAQTLGNFLAVHRLHPIESQCSATIATCCFTPGRCNTLNNDLCWLNCFSCRDFFHIFCNTVFAEYPLFAGWCLQHRVLHEGQAPLALQEKATKQLWQQMPHLAWAKRRSKMPHSRYLRNAWRTKALGVWWSP